MAKRKIPEFLTEQEQQILLNTFKSRPKTYKFIKELFNLEIMETE